MSASAASVALTSLVLSLPLAAQSSTVWSLRGESLFEDVPSTQTAGAGFAVSGGLDVDGDGTPDLLVGAPQAQVGELPGTGGVSVVSGADGSVIRRVSGAATGDRFGSAVALVPDVDGDGLADYVVGAPSDDPSRPVDEVFVSMRSGADGSELWRAVGIDRFQDEGFEGGGGLYDPGAWQTDGPDASFQVLTTADASMPSAGQGYLSLSAEGSVDATPPSVTTPGFGAPPEGTNRLHQTFQLTGEASLLELDYVFISFEGTASEFDDFFCVELRLGGLSYIAAYESVNTSSFDPGNESALLEEPTTARASLSVDLAQLFAAELEAQPASALDVILHVGNFDDGEAPSVAYVDGIQLRPAPGFAAAGVPLALEAGSFGACVAAVGDVNGDGIGDVFVGAPDARNTVAQAAAGRGNVLSGVDGSLIHALALGDEGSGFGGTASAAGDVNGDGFADLLIGETGSISGRRSHVVSGADGSVLAQGPNTTATAVAGGADLDGDGVLDQVVSGEGTLLAFPWDGSAGGWAAFGSDDSYGSAVAVLGDVNGDGFPDVGVGHRLAIVAPAEAFLDFTDAGVVDVHSGADGELLFRFEGDEKFAYLGQSLAAAGDVNLDGYADMLLGSPSLDPLFVEANAPGSADVVFGGNPWTFQPGDRFFQSVASNREHSYEFLANEGMRFSATLKAAKGSTLQPSLRVLGPLPLLDEVFAAEASVVKPNLARVKKLELIEAGRYRMEVLPASGSAGAYDLKTKGKYAKGKSKDAGLAPGAVLPLVLGDKPSGSIPESGGTVRHSFVATAGTRLSVKARRASKQELLTPVLILTGPGGQVLVSAEESAQSTTQARIQKFDLPSDGIYVLEVGAAGETSGAYRLTTKGKFPKGKAKVSEPEPLADAAAP